MALTPSYDPKKAALFNQLVQQGLDQDAASIQAGITDAEIENYAIGKNGQLGSYIANSGFAYTAEQLEQNKRNFQFVGYDEDPRGNPAQQPSAKTTRYTTTSTTEVSGGGTVNTIEPEGKPTPASRALQPAIDAKQAELEQFNRDNPSTLVRKRLGLPPLTPEETQKRNAQANLLAAQKVELTNQQKSAELADTPATVITTPNTTTNTTTVTTGTTSVNAPVQAPGGADQTVNQQTEINLGAAVGAANIKSVPVPPTGDEALQATEDAQAAALAAQEGRAFAPAPVSSTQAERDDAASVDAANKVQTSSPGAIPPSQTGYNGTAYDDEGFLNPGWTLNEQNEPVFIGGNFVEPATAASAEASRIAAGKQRAQEQQTLQARKNQPSAADWRVRLQLAAGANYLYKAGNNGSAAGILQPLYDTDGVIFPYTPQIDTSYTAKYDNYDLVHSNYRGYFYKSSSVDNLTVRGTFTAQDTKEAQYLLAVIHFFRSVTKMFYGQDAQAGTPPPLVYMSGLGQYQFNNHPCVVSNFTYNLPNDVDYIRADGFNNFGINLENRRNLSSGPAPSGGAGIRSRLVNSGLGNGSLKDTPSPQPVNQNVTNPSAINSTYVPTKMEISVTLLPMQTRSQVSKQFSLEGFAQGRLLQGGFW